MKHPFTKIFLTFVLFVTPLYAYADNFTDMNYSIGGPLTLLLHVIRIMLWVGGAGIFLGAIAQYQAHRKNPSQVRLTRPIILLIVGTVFILLPFVINMAMQNAG